MTSIKRLLRITILALGLLLTASAGAAFASANGTLYIEDQKVRLSQETLLDDGVTYAPVKEISQLMGWSVSYDSDTGRITVSNEMGDTLVFRGGRSQIVYNGKTYDIAQAVKLMDGTSYIPLRTLAEAMHAKVGWNAEDKAVVLRAADAYTVASGDTLSVVAATYTISAQALKARNGLEDASIEAGQQLKVVVPDFLDPETEDAALIAKMVEIEAGNESYAGKLAVANVILNRVRSDSFPDTVSGVIYAPGQFPPAGAGRLLTETASSDSLKAALAALAGENNVPGAVYFFNPKYEPGKVKLVTVVKKIGNHMFAK
ncbi:cell wall hydrolase [Cohnella lubricantis]|uniref:Cell wall hydrolase n=1 Tax=Cohnella lubricantis TaxID=2163172 RepID=A0A841TC14_9BACL|nr:cell wall hydrolase [Cohnella lubricantis]MBB6678552.1 cell wall hydrolase [Cohnella lubricantis]MBP2119139.1 LysM repeat protein [Cohnella lubricantis]